MQYYCPFKNLNGEDIPFDEIEYNDLSQLSNADEGYKIEYKGDFGDKVKKKLPKVICSFANCTGGWLFIGVDNNKQIVDIEKPNGEVELSIINIIKPYVDLEVANLIKARFIENPNKIGWGVIAVYIKEGLHPPYISNGSIFVRSGAQSEPIPAERSTVDYLYKKCERSSILLLKSIEDGKLKNNYKLLESPIIKKLGDAHDILFEQIAATLREHARPFSENELSIPSPIKPNAMFNFAIGEAVPSIEELYKEEFSRVREFVIVNELNIDTNELLNFGNLKLYKKFSFNLHTEITDIGSVQEKKKLNVILKIADLIQEEQDLQHLLSKVNGAKILQLALTNEGNEFDEDIILNIFIPKGSICDISKLELYSNSLKHNQKFMKIFASKTNSNIDEFDNYGIYPTVRTPIQIPLSLGNAYDKSDEEYETEKMNAEISYLYEPLEILTSDAVFDVIKIKFKKLLPNQTQILPAPLFLNCDIKEINYTIISKHSSRKIEEVIKSI